MIPTSKEQIRAAVLGALAAIAPEIDAASIDPAIDWRDQLDLDSVDLLNFVVRIHEVLGVDIPEEDYRKLSSLERCVEYLSARSGSA